MWDIKTLIIDFIKTKDTQEFINHRFKSDSEMVIAKNYFKYIGTDYAQFHLDDKHVDIIVQVATEYNYDDMRSTDIVLDIGANIGAYSLKVHKNVAQVYAVEPLMTDALHANIALNNVDNITVFDCALGNGSQPVEWMGQRKSMNCKTLSEIVDMCGGKVDVLKCDCEGGEWSINADELKGIRKIEMELHMFNGEDKKAFFNTLNRAGFDYTTDSRSNETLLIHAERRGV